MALKGIKVLEMAGLAPVPFCGMILADFGASVVRIDRASGSSPVGDILARGKRSIAVDLKKTTGQEVVRNLASKSDVLIEPFRPGVMEKLNLGPDKLLKDNPGLIYARLSGYGQTGPYRLKAGHDINYLAVSGILSMLGRKNENPTPPINLLADFGGGGLLCALGVLMCLYERTISKKGQVVDLSMVEGSAYLSSFVLRGRDAPIWGNPRGENLLDTGAPFYDTFKTQDGKYMAVGSLEPQFFAALKTGLGLDIEQFDDFGEAKQKISARFATKTRDEWTQIFDKLDACVTPVLEMDEAIKDEHNAYRKAFVKSVHRNHAEPEAAPKLSRTPGKADIVHVDPRPGEHTIEVLKEYGFGQEEIQRLIKDGAIDSLQSKM